MLPSPPAIGERVRPPPIGRRRPLTAIASTIVTAAAAVAWGAAGCDGSKPAPGAGGAAGTNTGPGGGGGAPGGPIAWQWTVACPGGREPTSPIDYGRCAIDQALLEQLAPASAR